MNDPGLDAPIQEEAEAIKQEQNDQVQGEDPDGVDDDEAYLEQTRWWFASTAFPLIAVSPTPLL
jgi:potassium channel subfamily K, other eukaryote